MRDFNNDLEDEVITAIIAKAEKPYDSLIFISESDFSPRIDERHLHWAIMRLRERGLLGSQPAQNPEGRWCAQLSDGAILMYLE